MRWGIPGLATERKRWCGWMVGVRRARDNEDELFGGGHGEKFGKAKNCCGSYLQQ